MFFFWNYSDTNKKTNEAKSLISQSTAPSYNSTTENDSLVNQVTSLLEQDKIIEARHLVTSKLESTEKIIKAVSTKEQTISDRELENLISSFEALKKLLIEKNTVYGYYVYGRPLYLTKVNNIIFGLNNLAKVKLLQLAEPTQTQTATPISYQNS